MRTSELASRAAVNPQTLRYYERRGLLAEPDRSTGGYRSYPPEAVRRVRFIKRAQELGFTLTEVETLLDLAGGGPESCDTVRTLAMEKITDLRRRIADLQALQGGLTVGGNLRPTALPPGMPDRVRAGHGSGYCPRTGIMTARRPP
jgi:DNA-binding transcriptional MerR regulator